MVGCLNKEVFSDKKILIYPIVTQLNKLQIIEFYNQQDFQDQ